MMASVLAILAGEVPMTAPTLARRWTAKDLDRMEDASHYELVDGQLVERTVSLISSDVAINVLIQMGGYVQRNNLGRKLNTELGIRINPADPDHTRRADGGFISWERLRTSGDASFLLVPPDLVVEVVSPSDIMSLVFAKVEEWLEHGVRVVWLVIPEQRRVEVHRLGQRPILLLGDDEITSEDILPGFRCSISAFFS